MPNGSPTTSDHNGPRGSFAHAYSRLLHVFSRSPEHRPFRSAHYVDIDEAKALLRFANERAIDGVTKSSREKLAQSIELYVKAAAGDDKQVSSARVVLSTAYGVVSDQTYSKMQVNGRTLIDSEKYADHYISRAGAIAFLILVVVLFVNFAAYVFPKLDVEYKYVDFALTIDTLFWGALGGSVYLMRTLSSAARHCRFDTARVESLLIMILLGGILGFTITKLVLISNWLTDTSTDLSIPLQFTEAGVAFLGGFGSKVVFGLLDTTINWITDLLSGRLIRK